MRNGFNIIVDFLSENNINNMEQFVTKMPIFPKFIQEVLAHRHKDYEFSREDMDRLFIYLMRNDKSQARA